jgi:hypothetical protein
MAAPAAPAGGENRDPNVPETPEQIRGRELTLKYGQDEYAKYYRPLRDFETVEETPAAYCHHARKHGESQIIHQSAAESQAESTVGQVIVVNPLAGRDRQKRCPRPRLEPKQILIY